MQLKQDLRNTGKEDLNRAILIIPPCILPESAGIRQIPGIPADSARNQPLNFKIGNYLHKGLARLLIFEVFIICILIFLKFIKYIY